MFYAYGYDKGSKLTRFEVWKRIKERTGKEAGDDPPLVSGKILYIWELYIEVKKGSESVTYTSILSYVTLMGIELTPWEIGLMIGIGRQKDD